jgi:uncharacterized protein YdhG (YjbR/CyaY superfamily)
VAASATTIDDYIRACPEDVQVILQQIRRTIQNAAPEAQETISYKIPTFALKGKDLVYFAAWKRYVSLYPLPATDEALERELARYRAAKSTARFPYNQPIPYDLIGRLVARHVAYRKERGD